MLQSPQDTVAPRVRTHSASCPWIGRGARRRRALAPALPATLYLLPQSRSWALFDQRLHLQQGGALTSLSHLNSSSCGEFRRSIGHGRDLDQTVVQIKLNFPHTLLLGRHRHVDRAHVAHGVVNACRAIVPQAMQQLHQPVHQVHGGHAKGDRDKQRKAHARPGRKTARTGQAEKRQSRYDRSERNDPEKPRGTVVVKTAVGRIEVGGIDRDIVGQIIGNV